MSDTDHDDPPDLDDRFAARVQAEVAAAAERRRREDVELARVEREIERVWAHVAPPGATGATEELLLDRVDRLSLIDVDAPVGDRPGIKQVKGAIRKGTYWYLRYMSDQLNALHNVHARLLRRMDERLTRLEAGAGIDARLASLVSSAPVPGSEIGRLLADRLGGSDRPVVVTSCGTGECVDALQAAGVRCFGIDADPDRVLAGLDDGLDLRVGDGAAELAAFERGALGAVVIAGELQRAGVSDLLTLLDSAVAAVETGGYVVVAPEQLGSRSAVDAELLAGRGMSAGAWCRAFDAAGLETDTLSHAEPGLDDVVVGRRR